MVSRASDSNRPPRTPQQAIRRVLDEGLLKVVYQPVVDLRTQKTFAFEALVRTTSDDFDNPMSLFAAAVQTACTGELGRKIRELAIQGSPSHPLFLNIHPAELNEHFIVQPDDPIFRHSEDVYLEITEGVPLSHFRLCQSILREVRGRGVYLVVDDLGAGYSNLKYIADLHPRVVKIDRDLVAGLRKDSRMFRLVKAIVVLCRELDALVVAEGIETESELDAVYEAGAHFGQGTCSRARPIRRPRSPPSTGRRRSATAASTSRRATRTRRSRSRADARRARARGHSRAHTPFRQTRFRPLRFAS